MRIHRIALRHFRGVERCEVVLPPTGVTVIVGPNEVGKSSLAEAVDLLLEFPHDSRHRRLLDVRPVDRDEGTEVEVELTTGPYHVVYRKRWFRQPATHLQVLAPRPERSTARQAHDRMRQILDETLDEALFRALRLLPDTDVRAGLGGAPSLVRALDAAAGGGADPTAESTLWEAVECERGRYWTPTGRASQERQQLAAQLARAETALRDATAALDDLEALGERSLAVQAELSVLVERETAATAELADATGAGRAVEAARHNVLARQRELAVAERAEAAVRHAHRARAAQVADVAARRQAASDAADQLAAAEPAHREAEAAAGQRRQAHTGVEAACRSARQALSLADGDRQFRRAQLDLGLLADRRRRVDRARAEEATARGVLGEAVVDPTVRPAVEAAVRRLAEARAAQRAASPVVEVEALADVVVTVDGRPAAAVRGDRHEEVVLGSSTLQVGDLARIQVRIGGSAAGPAADVADAEQALGELVERFRLDGDDPLGSLSRALDARRDAEQALAQARRTRDEALGGDSEAALEAAHARAAALVEHYLTTRPGEPPVPDSLEAAEAAHRRAAEALGALEVEEQGLRQQVAGAERTAHDRRTALETARQLHRRHADELASAEAGLALARAERSDEALADDLVGAEETLGKARAAVAAAEAHLRSLDPDATERRLGAAARQAEALAAERRRLEATAIELRATLREKGQADLQATAELHATEVQRLRAEHETLERRAAAADRLHHTLDQHRRAARQAYVAPYRRHLERLARLVFGPDTVLDLDPADLAVTSRTCGGATVPHDALSTGAREQLAVLTRLAAAIVVAGGDDPDAGVPVVLDDALGCTDAGRLRRLAPAFAAAAGTQVIVLTAHLDRYQALDGVTVVELGGEPAEP